MSRVFSDFPDRDDGGPEQVEFTLPASRREPGAGTGALPGEPARAEFFRAQRRPVLPLLGLVAAVATVAVFLWLGREDEVPGPAPAGDELLAAVASAPGLEPTLAGAATFAEEAPAAAGPLAAATAQELIPMPAVPSVLDERSPAPTDALPAEAAPATLAPHAFAVQLLAARSEADVSASWNRLRGSYPDLLAALTPSVTRTSRAEGGTFFRLRAGPLRDRASADELCRALSQRQQSCFVVSPGS